VACCHLLLLRLQLQLRLRLLMYHLKALGRCLPLWLLLMRHLLIL
jgi:hypothetical protein